MATIHPSRMALISRNERPSVTETRRRSPSPRRRRSPSPRRSRSPRRGQEEEGGRGSGRDHSKPRAADNDKYHSERTGRSRERDRSMDDSAKRRASPSYDDYKRPAHPNGGGDTNVPWRQQSNMYPSKGDRRPYNDVGRGGGGADFLESRRIQREAMTFNVWPPSPKAPARALSPKRSKSSKKSKRARSSSVSSDSSEEERRRRERKERKRARKEKDREHRSDKKRRHRSRSRDRRQRSDSVDSEEDRHRHHRRKTTPPRSRTPSRTRSPSRSRAPSEDEWVVKTSNPPPVSLDAPSSHVHTNPPAATRDRDQNENDLSDDEIGPTPLPVPQTRKFDERNYGGQLLRGEGSAMAAFLQDGTESRIPRRGEIGLTSDEIAKYEEQGYVMSGSRHRRMNAVRMRKENQVISAEEKRGILKLQKEEQARREAILREEFSELVKEKLKGAPGPKPQ